MSLPSLITMQTASPVSWLNNPRNPYLLVSFELIYIFNPMADVIFMKSNHESHAVLRCLRRAENSYPLKFLSNETLENRNEEEASQKRSFVGMYAKYIVCKLLQVLQHAHLHLAIFYSYPSYHRLQRHSNSCSSATFSYCKVCIFSSSKAQSRRFAFQ